MIRERRRHENNSGDGKPDVSFVSFLDALRAETEKHRSSRRSTANNVENHVTKSIRDHGDETMPLSASVAKTVVPQPLTTTSILTAEICTFNVHRLMVAGVKGIVYFSVAGILLKAGLPRPVVRMADERRLKIDNRGWPSVTVVRAKRNNNRQHEIATRQQKASIADKQQKASVADKQQKASVADEQQKASVADKQRKASVANKQQKASVADKQQKSSVADIQQKVSVADIQQKVSFADRLQKASVADKQQKASVADIQQKVSFADRLQKASVAAGKSAKKVICDYVLCNNCRKISGRIVKNFVARKMTR